MKPEQSAELDQYLVDGLNAISPDARLLSVTAEAEASASLTEVKFKVRSGLVQHEAIIEHFAQRLRERGMDVLNFAPSVEMPAADPPKRIRIHSALKRAEYDEYGVGIWEAVIMVRRPPAPPRTIYPAAMPVPDQVSAPALRFLRRLAVVHVFWRYRVPTLFIDDQEDAEGQVFDGYN